jgi:hypothetical protein
MLSEVPEAYSPQNAGGEIKHVWKVKLSLKQAVKARRIVRRRGSHMF